jgi:hypothetical protein
VSPYRRPAPPDRPTPPEQGDDVDPWRVALVVAWGLDLWRMIAAIQSHRTPWPEIGVASLVVVLSAVTLFWP